MQLPDSTALIDGARALGVSLSPEQVATLLAYLTLLSKWSRVYNLTAVRDRDAMIVHHLLDSVAVVAPLRRWTGGQPARVLDVGSGAGLPGAVIAILLPEIDVTCVDAVGKKAAFIRQVAAELALRNLHVVHARAEVLTGEPFDVIVSRAFASLANFVSLTRRHVGAGSVWLAMKGHVPAEELDALPKAVDVFHVEQLAVPGLDAARCIVWMREGK